MVTWPLKHVMRCYLNCLVCGNKHWCFNILKPINILFIQHEYNNYSNIQYIYRLIRYIFLTCLIILIIMKSLEIKNLRLSMQKILLNHLKWSGKLNNTYKYRTRFDNRIYKCGLRWLQYSECIGCNIERSVLIPRFSGINIKKS